MFTRLRVARAYLRGSLRCLCNALRVLLRGIPKPPPELLSKLQSEVEEYLASVPPHPSELCVCVCGKESAPADHDAGCKWLAAMCRACDGHGWCPQCQGEGLRAESQPAPLDRDTPEIAVEDASWVASALGEDVRFTASATLSLSNLVHTAFMKTLRDWAAQDRPLSLVLRLRD